ncbi:MAG: hypothetical protein H6625_02895 [Bdellovibrionaceae bacterium]|nr:hypothetical protein [Pseudobdellovibrionaceae bacterium]
MTSHILLIDPLEKLNIKKDSSLFLALTLKEMGQKVFLLFPPSLYFQNSKTPQLEVYDFEGRFIPDSFYISEFMLSKNTQRLKLDNNITLHMRLDPPFDLKYLRTLWTLQALKMYGLNIINDSMGILANNEKLFAYSNAIKKFPSFLGESVEMLREFLFEQKQLGVKDVILKPVDLFQGVGVQKSPLDMDLVINIFIDMKKKYHGAVVVQPFAKNVEKGEIRATFFDNKEIGSILKIPPPGSHLANIAQGATFSKINLKPEVLLECQRINQKLADLGIRWTAFDILDDTLSEVNITCPGLLVETSIAHNQNLALTIAKLI